MSGSYTKFKTTPFDRDPEGFKEVSIIVRLPYLSILAEWQFALLRRVCTTQMKYCTKLFLRPPLKTEKSLFIHIWFLSILIIQYSFLGHSEAIFFLITFIILSVIEQNDKNLLWLVVFFSIKNNSTKICSIFAFDIHPLKWMVLLSINDQKIITNKLKW